MVTQHVVPFIAEKKNFATDENFLNVNHSSFFNSELTKQRFFEQQQFSTE